MKPSTRQHLRRAAYIALAVLGVVTATLVAGAYYFLRPYYLRASLYDLRKLSQYNVATIFQDRHGTEIGRFFIEDRVLLKHKEIPDAMRQAVVAMEDRRFYEHSGVDFKGIGRALRENLRRRSYTQGGSTITQQVAKHLIGRFERTWDRKLVEAFVALRIERNFSKEEILDLYLNRIYFGRGYYGLEAATQGYFGKHASQLTVAECAALAAIIRAPNTFSPWRDPEAALRRRNLVLCLMEQQKMLTPVETGSAMGEPMRLVSRRQVREQSYFLAMAAKELRQLFDLDEEEEIPQGLTVGTTLDLPAQRAAEATVREQLNPFVNGTGGEPDAATLQAAAVAIDLQTGAVRVLIGGRDYKKSPFDRACMARLENGAVFQPVLYALAFERLGLNPASMINASYLDEMPLNRSDKPGLGNPDTDLGKPFLMVQDALTFGNPSAALRTERELGEEEIDAWLQSAGTPRTVRDKPPVTSDLTLYDLTSLYQMLGNGGIRTEPYCIETVINDNGETLYQVSKKTGRPLLSPSVAQQTILSLQAATQESGAKVLSGWPVAGMSGASSGYRDVWYVGCTSRHAAGVWLGYDKPTPIEPRAAAMQAAPAIWSEVLRHVQGPTIPAPFAIPKELTKVEVDRRTGTLQGQGFMTPAPGHAFVYLRPGQIEKLQNRPMAQPQDGLKDWSTWLSTMASPSPVDATLANAIKGTTPPAVTIPPALNYRLPALRGKILTADGKVLATMTQSQDLVLAWPPPEVAADEESVLGWIRSRLALVKDWIQDDVDLSDDALRSLFRFQRFNPILVARNLTPAQLNAFRNRRLNGQNFSLQGVPRRIYPGGGQLAHVVGYLQRKQARSVKEFQAGDVIYDDYQGAAGIEASFDEELRGSDGNLTIETSPDGFARRAMVTKEATIGNSVRLTIDSRIQAAAENAFGETQLGAVVVMNIRNGDLVAMVSRPTFNPNEFLPLLPAEKWQALNQEEGKPLLDRVYRQHNPPGSIFKIVTTLAAMRAGVFDPARTVRCPGYFDVGDIRYLLPKEKSPPVAFHDAIAHSFNTYFFDLGLRAGRETLLGTARDFGLGQPTGFLLPGELPGLIPDDDFVRRVHHRAMGPGDVTNTAIGQGDVLVTPLQMVTMLSAIANGGTVFRPRLVRQIEDSAGQVKKSFPEDLVRTVEITPDQSRQLTDGLVAATEEGTARAARVPGIQLATKTGTAQVGSKSRPRQIAWLVGYVPANAPRYAFAVMIEGNWDQDLHGGSDAAPVAGKLFARVFAPLTSVAAQAPPEKATVTPP